MLQDGASESLAMEVWQDRNIREVSVVSTSAAGACHAGKRSLIPGGDHMSGIDDQIASLFGRPGFPANTISDQLVPLGC